MGYKEYILESQLANTEAEKDQESKDLSLLAKNLKLKKNYQARLGLVSKGNGIYVDRGGNTYKWNKKINRFEQLKDRMNPSSGKHV